MANPMLFLNEKEILGNAASDAFAKIRKDAMDILSVAVNAVDPGDSIRNNLRIEGGTLVAGGATFNLECFSDVFVIGGGKAGGAMAQAVEERLGSWISGGSLNVLKGTEESYNLEKIALCGASHPVPDEDCVLGVEQMFTLMERAGSDTLFIVLISGGGSSLMTYPSEDVSLEEIQYITGSLLRSGATINELNAVRKHLSSIKGGLLAKRAYPATVLSLILSDVIGDPLDAIASGPTAPDGTTFGDAIMVLKTRGLWDGAPPSIRHRFERGYGSEIEETPKIGDKVFERVHNILIGSNIVAARAALGRAHELGYNPIILSTMIEGEAREVGAVISGISKEIHATNMPVGRPAAVVVGGETTVTVIGNGIGGRNQELALGASLKISGQETVIATLATDGIDGPTDAAGAIVDGSTLDRAMRLGMEPQRYLADNNSNEFFTKLGDAFITGPTGTNVNDLTLILVSD